MAILFWVPEADEAGESYEPVRVSGTNAIALLNSLGYEAEEPLVGQLDADELIDRTRALVAACDDAPNPQADYLRSKACQLWLLAEVAKEHEVAVTFS